MKTGIYKIGNIFNEDIYIGSALHFNKRRLCHWSNLRLNKHSNRKLQNSVNKYGLENFYFKPLVTCPPEYRIKLEQWFLDNLNPYYNILKVADSREGLPVSKKTRKKLSDVHIGKPKLYNRNPIISININTGETLEFDSTIEASEYFNCHPSSITRVLTGKRYRNGNYKFEYKYGNSRNNTVFSNKTNKEHSLKYKSKLNKEKVLEIKQLLKQGKSCVEIAKLYKVHAVTISSIKTEKTWKNI